MSVDAYRTREPDTRDEGPDPQREDEAIREQRWAAFQGIVRQRLRAVKLSLAAPDHLSNVLEEVSNGRWLMEERGRPWDPNAFEAACCDFAKVEGWSGVLTAIARVLREQEQQEPSQ